MSDIKRKIHVIGINSFEFKELPLNLQNLFIETVNIAIPDSYFKHIQLWAEKNTKQKKLLFASNDWAKNTAIFRLILSVLGIREYLINVS